MTVMRDDCERHHAVSGQKEAAIDQCGFETTMRIEGASSRNSFSVLTWVELVRADQYPQPHDSRSRRSH